MLATMSATFQILLGATLSLGASWYVAARYFQKQREIDREKENKEIQLAFTKLMHSYFEVLRKRPKLSSQSRLAMAEFEARLKILKPEYDAHEIMQEAAEQAQQFIDEHPNDFEDI